MRLPPGLKVVRHARVLCGYSLLTTRVAGARAVRRGGVPRFADWGRRPWRGPVLEPAPGPEASPHHLLAVIDELSEEETDPLLGAQP